VLVSCRDSEDSAAEMVVKVFISRTTGNKEVRFYDRFIYRVDQKGWAQTHDHNSVKP